MVGQIIERLKDPKNPVTCIIAAWVLAIIGYFIFIKLTIEPAGQLIGGLGVLWMLLTLVRLSVTKIVYAVICIVFVIIYVGVYSSKVEWKSGTRTVTDEVFAQTKTKSVRYPHYTGSGEGVQQQVIAAVFAPAAMGNAIWEDKYAGVGIEDHVDMIKLGEHSELKEGVKSKK